MEPNHRKVPGGGVATKRQRFEVSPTPGGGEEILQNVGVPGCLFSRRSRWPEGSLDTRPAGTRPAGTRRSYRQDCSIFVPIAVEVVGNRHRGTSGEYRERIRRKDRQGPADRTIRLLFYGSFGVTPSPGPGRRLSSRRTSVPCSESGTGYEENQA